MRTSQGVFWIPILSLLPFDEEVAKESYELMGKDKDNIEINNRYICNPGSLTNDGTYARKHTQLHTHPHTV